MENENQRGNKLTQVCWKMTVKMACLWVISAFGVAGITSQIMFCDYQHLVTVSGFSVMSSDSWQQSAASPKCHLLHDVF